MKKRKWIKKILIIVIVLAAIGGGAAAGIRYWMSNRGTAVEVYEVSDINAADWISYDDMDGASGTVLSDVSQSVQIPDDKVINEVYVEEGDEVKIGDKLLSYDTTILELDQELQALTVTEIELEIKAAEADLQKLKNTTPVASKSEDDELDYYSSFDTSWDFDSEDDEARLVSSDRAMMAAQEGTEETNVTEQTETAAAETTAEQVLDESEAAVQEAVQESTEAVSSEEESEQVLGDSSEGIVENLTPSDLDKGTADSSSDTEELLGEILGTDEANKPKLNQSLQPFLKNIRIKEMQADQSETLLLDTVQYEEDAVMTVSLSGKEINLIPHFKEDSEHQFVKRNTYLMYIKGIQLEEDVAGKIYGTAVIDGNDYPEIGGFTCVQDEEAEDVVKVTLAFHDGLEEQQADGALLADMYLELHVKAEEVTGDSLIFVTSDKEKENLTIELDKPEDTTPETELVDSEEIPADDALMESVGESVQSDSQSEDTVEDESQTGETEESEQLLSEEELEEETSLTEESETESETEDTSAPVSGFTVTVNWDHGTNDRSKWPSELVLRFYEDEEDADPLFTEVVSASYAEDGGTGEEDGEEEPETESEVMTEDISEEGESEQTESSAGTTEIVEDTEDPYDVTSQVWKNIPISWSADRLNPGQYYVSVYVPNYIPTITWDAANAHYIIQMKYLEPVESPLVKLDPLSELTFASGAEGMYYKGSGTAEDPYVFFCTDGAVIRSSFVNWVLGFDELGTTRISDGYYVRLEIRESDTITGAFIRSVGLDGTIRVEYGYDPNTYWIFSSDTGIVKYQEEVTDDLDYDLPSGGYNPSWTDSGVTYTAEELAYAIEEKERELRQLRVDEKKANLELKKYNKELEESVVVSSVNGYVQSLGSSDSDAFMVVTSEGGFYVKSTISEMDLDRVEKGQTINCTSWETGNVFTATITQIDSFPSSTTNSDYYWSGGNVNSSNYPILAVVDDPDMVSEYESVSVQIPKETSSGSSIYLEKAFIRSENGQSYVFVVDENGLLKKQYVRTGSNSYGYIEIKEGLSRDDRIAFPYGKSVKEGAKTVSIDEDYY